MHHTLLKLNLGTKFVQFVSPNQRPTKKARKQSISTASTAEDFFIFCWQTMPRKLSCAKTIGCNTYKSILHLKCADMRASFSTYVNCVNGWIWWIVYFIFALKSDFNNTHSIYYRSTHYFIFTPFLRGFCLADTFFCCR